MPQQLELIARCGDGATLQQRSGEGEARGHVGRRGFDDTLQVALVVGAVELGERVQCLQMGGRCLE